MPASESHAPDGLDPVDVRTIDERASHCFGCGPDNPEGLHLSFLVESTPDAITSTVRVNLTRLHEGPPGHIHGGIIATLMDEAMSKLNRALGVIAMTRNLNVDYLRPSPLGVELTLVGRHLQRDGRKLHHEAELIHPNGTILARAKGFFIAIDPALLEKMR
ncbi:PaaI family thioesterase [Granulicella sp. WH15]|uniref:PaaI family thioesterase n=1 Tax=Granulicella sp. WH15 TaxID=2602070 RepID=UPI0013679AF6|nr:PaaI family thioesterase [Granulicella sp. WH15]QHN03688.1 PaaI family thioesterase [Granulicella sp. WH15]